MPSHALPSGAVPGPSTLAVRTASILPALVLVLAWLAAPTAHASAPLPNGGALPLLVAPATHKKAEPFAAATVEARFGIPLAKGWKVPVVNGRPGLGLVGAQRWSFRTLEQWPDGSVKWALGTASVTAGTGAAPLSLSVAFGAGHSGQAALASTVGSRIVVDAGPLRAEISKTAFNLLDRVLVDGVQIVAPGMSPGIFGTTLAGQPLTIAGTLVQIEENGPSRAVVRADGTLMDGGTAVLDFTCRLAFVHGSRDVEVTFTVRNANIQRPQHYMLSSIELGVRIQPGGTPSASFALPAGQLDLPWSTGTSAYAYQAYSSADTTGATGTGPAFIPSLPKTGASSFAQEGYFVLRDGAVVHASPKTQYPAHPFARLRGSAGGATVTIQHMPWLWPAALELTAANDVVAGVFTKRNAGAYTFCWRQHESRTAVFSFHAGAAAPEPAEVSRRLESPVIGRLAEYRLYEATGGTSWELMTIAEQQSVYALLGVPHVISVANEGLSVIRHLPAGQGGGENNHDGIERRLLAEFLRTGAGGQFVNAMDQALYKSEWQILRSDNFDHAQDPGAVNPGLPHSTGFAGDDEHRYRDGIALAYRLTGDERFRDALLDEVEILPTRPVWPHERSMYQMLRALVAVADFAKAGATLDPLLRERVQYFCTPVIDVNSASSGWGWQAPPAAGNRGYFVNSTQNNSEKAPGESFVTRGFITAALGPSGLRAAVLRLGLGDPDGLLASRRIRDLALYTRQELFPWFADPAQRHLVYSYNVKLQTVNEWEISDFHPILVGMVHAWRQTGDVGYLKKGLEQLQAFAAHGHMNVLDGRVEAQLFCRAVLDYLASLGLGLPALP